ncbi:MAG: hypothetical protein ACREE7_19295, partial [Dongiaceae bacterium]
FDPKPLVPHLTCYRDVKRGTHPFFGRGGPTAKAGAKKGMRPLFEIEPLRWAVRSFALVQSVAGQYHVVSQWPLQTASVTNVKTVQAPGGTE